MDKQDRVGGIDVSKETDRNRLHNAAAFLVKPAVTWFAIKRQAALLPLRPHPSYFLPRSPRKRYSKTGDNDLSPLNDHDAESDFSHCETRTPSSSPLDSHEEYAGNEVCAVNSNIRTSNFGWDKESTWDCSVNSVRRSIFKLEEKVKSYRGQELCRHSFDFYRDDSDILKQQDFRQLSRSKVEVDTSTVDRFWQTKKSESPSFDEKHSNSLSPSRSPSDQGRNSELKNNPPHCVWESDKGKPLCENRFQGSSEPNKEHFDDTAGAQNHQQRQQHNSVPELSYESNPSTSVCCPKTQAELQLRFDRRKHECSRHCNHSYFQSEPADRKKCNESVNGTLTKTRTDNVIDTIYFSNEKCPSSPVLPSSEHLILKSDRSLSKHETHIAIPSAASPSRDALSLTLKNSPIPNSSYLKLLGTNSADSDYSSGSTSPSTIVKDTTTNVCKDSHTIDGRPSNGDWTQEFLGKRLTPSVPRQQFDRGMNPFILQQGLAMGSSVIPAASFGIRVTQTTDGHTQPTQNARHSEIPLPSADFRQSEWPSYSAISGQNQSMFSMFSTATPGTSEQSKASANTGENGWPLYSMNPTQNPWMLSLANIGKNERSISPMNSGENEQPLNLSEQGRDQGPLLPLSVYPIQHPVASYQGSCVSRTTTSMKGTHSAADPNTQAPASRQALQGTLEGNRKRPADSDNSESQVTYPPSKRTNAGFCDTQNSVAKPTPTDENENLIRKQERLSSQPRPLQPQPRTVNMPEQQGSGTADGIVNPGVYDPGSRQNPSVPEVPKTRGARGRGTRRRRGRGAASGRGQSNVNGEERPPLPHPMSLPTINGVWPELLIQQSLQHQMSLQQPNPASLELPHPMSLSSPHPLAFPMPHPMSLAFNQAQALSAMGLQHYGLGELDPMGITSQVYPFLGYPDPMALALQHFYSQNLDILGLGSQGNSSPHPGTNDVASHQHRPGEFESTGEPSSRNGPAHLELKDIKQCRSSCTAPEGLASQRTRTRKSKANAEASQHQLSEQRKQKASQQSQSEHSSPNYKTTQQYGCWEAEPKDMASTQHHQGNLEPKGVHQRQYGLADPISRKPVSEPSNSESRDQSSEGKDQPTSKPRSHPTTKPFIHPSREDDNKLRSQISEPLSQQFSGLQKQSSGEVNQSNREPRNQSSSEVKTHTSSKKSSRSSGKVKLQTDEPINQPTSELKSQKTSEPRSELRGEVNQPCSNPTNQPTSQPQSQSSGIVNQPTSESRSGSSGEVNQPNSELKSQPSSEPRNQSSGHVKQPISKARSQPTDEQRNQSGNQVNQTTGEPRSPSTNEPRSQTNDQVIQPINKPNPQPVGEQLFQSSSQQDTVAPILSPLPCELPFRLSSGLLPASEWSTTDDSLIQQELSFKEWREKALRVWQEKIDRIPFFTTEETAAPDHPRPVKPKPLYHRMEGKEYSSNQHCYHRTADPKNASMKLQHEASEYEIETDTYHGTRTETCQSQSEVNRYGSQTRVETDERCSPQNIRGQDTESHDAQTDDSQSAAEAFRYVPETVKPAVRADQTSRADAEVHSSQTHTNQHETEAHSSQLETNRPNAEVHYSQQLVKQEVRSEDAEPHSSLPGANVPNTEAHSSEPETTRSFTIQLETRKQNTQGYCQRSETNPFKTEPTFCFQPGTGQAGAQWYYPKPESDRLTTSCSQRGSGPTCTQQYCTRAETNKLELETTSCSQLGTSHTGTESHLHQMPLATQSDIEPAWPPLQVQKLFDTLTLPQLEGDEFQVVVSEGNTLAYNSLVHVEDISP